jgi:hypothetical protein
MLRTLPVFSAGLSKCSGASEVTLYCADLHTIPGPYFLKDWIHKHGCCVPVCRMLLWGSSRISITCCVHFFDRMKNQFIIYTLYHISYIIYHISYIISHHVTSYLSCQIISYLIISTMLYIIHDVFSRSHVCDYQKFTAQFWDDSLGRRKGAAGDFFGGGSCKL